jgi:hypothetical protein
MSGSCRGDVVVDRTLLVADALPACSVAISRNSPMLMLILKHL